MAKQKKNLPWELAEAVVEVRFSSKLPQDAILGTIYNELSDRYEGPKNLPILQIPEILRQQDPNLKYQPHYQFSNEDYFVEIGPKVLTIRNHPALTQRPYIGWTLFLKEVDFLMSVAKKCDLMNECERIGVRYLNFFENLNVFDEIKFSISTPGIEEKSKFLGLEVEDRKFKTKLQISNSAEIVIKGAIKKGSIIDIDTSGEQIELVKMRETIDEAHTITEKLLFDKMLTEEYIDSTKSEK